MTTHRTPSTPRRWIGAGLTCALTLGGLAWFTLADAPTDEPSAQAHDGARGLETPTLSPKQFNARMAGKAPCAFTPGARMAYALTSRTTVELDMNDVAKQVDVGPQGAVATSEATRRDIERDWTLELEAVAADNDSVVLAARIQDRGIRDLDGGAPPEASAALADTFLIRVDPRCSIREFGWRTDGDLDATREQQLMAAGLGFWAPQDTSEAAAYGASSWDMSGSYKTSYAYEEGGKIRGEVVSFASPQTQITVLASTIEVQLAPAQWFASLTNERDLELAFHGVPFGTHFRSTTAAQTELGDFAPAVDLDDGGWSWGRLGAEQRDASATFDPALADMAFEDALDRYRELVASGTVSQYGGLLRDWLRANPEQTERLLDELRAGTFDDDQKGRGGLFFALGAAGTPEAGEALVGLLSSGSDRTMHQISAAQALAMSGKPTEPMLEALRDASAREDLHEVERGSMALALGTFARESADEHPELAAAAREEIADWLANPADPDDATGLSHSLLAAGNAGHDELAASVAGYLEHEDATVRRSATHAMRNMSPEAAFPSLERSLADEDRVVRTSALETAVTVARTHERAPTEGMRELATDALASEHMAERAAAVSLLDEAAKRGDQRAREALQAELREQLDDGDPKQVALLGRGMSGQWKAD